MIRVKVRSRKTVERFNKWMVGEALKGAFLYAI